MNPPSLLSWTAHLTTPHPAPMPRSLRVHAHPWHVVRETLKRSGERTISEAWSPLRRLKGNMPTLACAFTWNLDIVCGRLFDTSLRNSTTFCRSSDRCCCSACCRFNWFSSASASSLFSPAKGGKRAGAWDGGCLFLFFIMRFTAAAVARALLILFVRMIAKSQMLQCPELEWLRATARARDWV